MFFLSFFFFFFMPVIPLASVYIQNKGNPWVAFKQSIDHSMDLSYGHLDKKRMFFRG